MCEHNWIPIEVIAGRRVYQDSTMYIDWSSNIINAHCLRVVKLYCSKCGALKQIKTGETNNANS